MIPWDVTDTNTTQHNRKDNFDSNDEEDEDCMWSADILEEKYFFCIVEVSSLMLSVLNKVFCLPYTEKEFLTR